MFVSMTECVHMPKYPYAGQRMTLSIGPLFPSSDILLCLSCLCVCFADAHARLACSEVPENSPVSTSH